MKKIGVIIGSLRKDSYSKKVYDNFKNLSDGIFEIEEIKISELCIYNQDLDENPPKEWLNFKETLNKYSAIIFITPEYNRSIPAIIKNAVDIGSRPYLSNSWENKVAAVISVSPGGLGGVLCSNHLKQVLSYLNMEVINYPEVYIGNIESFLKNDVIIDEKTIEILKKLIKVLDRKIS